MCLEHLSRAPANSQDDRLIVTWLLDHLENSGFAILDPLVAPDMLRSLQEALDDLPADASTRTRGREAFARRNLLDVPLVRQLCASPPVRNLVEQVLGTSARAVRGILFDKRPGAN